MVGVLLVAVGPMARPGPAVRADDGSLVFAIGDSLTIGMSPHLPSRAAASGWGGIRIDAFKSRGIRTKVGADPTTGLGAVTSLRQRFGDTESWIVALGTNDAGSRRARVTQLIREMLDAIGPGHRVLWVNVHLPRTPGVQQAWNTSLDQVAAERPDQLLVLDWASIAARQRGIMAPDGVHLTAAGYALMAAEVATASESLRFGAERVTSPPVSPLVPPSGVWRSGGLVPTEPVRLLDTRPNRRRLGRVDDPGRPLEAGCRRHGRGDAERDCDPGERGWLPHGLPVRRLATGHVGRERRSR